MHVSLETVLSKALARQGYAYRRRVVLEGVTGRVYPQDFHVTGPDDEAMVWVHLPGPADADVVGRFHDALRDVGIEAGVLVAPEGFTPEALDAAPDRMACWDVRELARVLDARLPWRLHPAAAEAPSEVLDRVYNPAPTPADHPAIGGGRPSARPMHRRAFATELRDALGSAEALISCADGLLEMGPTTDPETQAALEGFSKLLEALDDDKDGLPLRLSATAVPDADEPPQMEEDPMTHADDRATADDDEHPDDPTAEPDAVAPARGDVEGTTAGDRPAPDEGKEGVPAPDRDDAKVEAAHAGAGRTADDPGAPAEDEGAYIVADAPEATSPDAAAERGEVRPSGDYFVAGEDVPTPGGDRPAEGPSDEPAGEFIVAEDGPGGTPAPSPDRDDGDPSDVGDAASDEPEGTYIVADETSAPASAGSGGGSSRPTGGSGSGIATGLVERARAAAKAQASGPSVEEPEPEPEPEDEADGFIEPEPIIDADGPVDAEGPEQPAEAPGAADADVPIETDEATEAEPGAGPDDDSAEILGLDEPDPPEAGVGEDVPVEPGAEILGVDEPDLPEAGVGEDVPAEPGAEILGVDEPGMPDTDAGEDEPQDPGAEILGVDEPGMPEAGADGDGPQDPGAEILSADEPDLAEAGSEEDGPDDEGAEILGADEPSPPDGPTEQEGAPRSDRPAPEEDVPEDGDAEILEAGAGPDEDEAAADDPVDGGATAEGGAEILEVDEGGPSEHEDLAPGIQTEADAEPEAPVGGGAEILDGAAVAPADPSAGEAPEADIGAERLDEEEEEEEEADEEAEGDGGDVADPSGPATVEGSPEEGSRGEPDPDVDPTSPGDKGFIDAIVDAVEEAEEADEADGEDGADDAQAQAPDGFFARAIDWDDEVDDEESRPAAPEEAHAAPSAPEPPGAPNEEAASTEAKAAQVGLEDDRTGPDRLVVPEIDSERAMTLVTGMVHGPMTTSLEHVPWYLYRYSLKMEDESNGHREHGRVWVHSETLAVEHVPEELETVRGHVAHPGVREDKAKDRARRAVLQHHRRRTRIVQEDAHTTLIEERDVVPDASSLELDLEDVVGRPYWRVAGQNGEVVLDAIVGEVVQDDAGGPGLGGGPGGGSGGGGGAGRGDGDDGSDGDLMVV